MTSLYDILKDYLPENQNKDNTMEMNLTARKRQLQKMDTDMLAETAIHCSQQMHDPDQTLSLRIKAFGTKLICEQIIKENQK